MSRRQSSRRHQGVHPTYSKILEQAVIVLAEDGFDRFSVQRVLDGASVSRATLYNHFPDVDTLIEAALVSSYAQENVLYRTRLALVVEESSDRASFRAALRKLIDDFGHVGSVVRYRRAHTITLSASRANLASALAVIQDEITGAWSDTIRHGQSRGFIRADIDPHDVAVMVQSLTIGRIIDDVAANHIGDERWSKAWFDIIDRAFLTAVD